MPEIHYPGGMDYSRPAQKGVDDSSGFIRDSEANAKDPTEEPVVPEKTSFFRGLFGRKKNKQQPTGKS